MMERMLRVVLGWFRLKVTQIEAANPEALLENERENLRTQISKFNQGLVSHAAMCERLIGQVNQLADEEESLTAKTRAHLAAGNRDAAKQCALRLTTVSRELVENRKQAENAERTYRELIAARDVAVDAARAKIEKLRREIDELRVEKAMAELNSMAAGLIGSVSDAGDTLGRLEFLVNEERSRARGTSRVMQDALDVRDVQAQAAELDALAEQALAEFASRDGGALDAPAQAADSPVRQIPMSTQGGDSEDENR